MSIWNGKQCRYCSYAGCDGGMIGHARFMLWLKFHKHTPKRLVKRLKRWWTALDYSRIEDVEIDGIDTRDYPDFCDAYISSATYKGREMTDSELDRLNEDSSYVYERVMEHIY